MRLFDALRARARGGGKDAGELRRRLAAAEARIEKLLEREVKRRDQAASLERKLRDAEQALRVQREKGERQRRRVLSSTVLQDLLPARRQQLTARAGALAAEARESKLLQASVAYRQTLDAGQPAAASAVHMQLDGLDWWVPLSAADRGWNERNAVTESLPYRALIHTREVCTGGVMLDLGAHNGSTAIPRVILGDVEACYCAEPDPINYACLVANVVGNGLRGFVLPDRIAIGGAEGTARLVQHKSSRGHHVAASASPGASVVDVPVTTLDAWVQHLGVDPRAISFVKSDIQGYELQMLAAAPRLLACRHIAWQLEYAPKLLAGAGGEPRELFALLQNHFTHFIDLNADAGGRRVRPVSELEEALDYVERRARSPHTDLIVYSATR